jgi:alkyl hydroperoxide reductase subunit AhpC
VFFYLGHGCVHCLEQLNALAPAAPDFKAAGIDMLAISADSADALGKTQALAKAAGGFPFPIVADAQREVFKAYRAYDGFENVPLHGVFLLDGNGLVRWQDIGYEPFTDVKFLLAEAKRQLQQIGDKARLPKGVTAAVGN